MFAAVDLGSNSFRMHIGSYDGGEMRIIKSARDPIRLAAGLDEKGLLTDQAMAVALESLRCMNSILKEYPLDAVRVVATNTLRIAKNAADFLPAAEKAIGYPIEIISGEEEGRLIYMGVTNTLQLPQERRLVIDIGGGSTELILGAGSDIEQVESFGIGTVKHSLSSFVDGKIDATSFDTAILSARSLFEDAAAIYHPKYWTTAYGSSGTIRAISDAVSKNGLGDACLTYKGLEALKNHFIKCEHVSRINLTGIKPERASMVLGGLAILIGLVQELGIEKITSIEAGLRMGVLWDLELRATKRDRREQSVRGFMERFHVDHRRANEVAMMSSAIFTQLKPSSDAYHRYLFWAGLLHEAGLAVSHSGYHKHAAYLIENADLPGFTKREQVVMSSLILAQKGNLRKINGLLPDLDFAKAALALRVAIIFMHARIGADLGDMRIKMKNKIEMEIKREWVSHHRTISYWMDKEKEAWEEVGINFIVKLYS